MPVYGAPEWVSQLSIWLLISPQVMISRFMKLSPALGSVLTVWSLLTILSLSLSLSPLSLTPFAPLPHSQPFSLSQIKNKVKGILKKCYVGAPGWLSPLSVQLQLRSWSCGSQVRALCRALCWQLRALSLLQIPCLPLSLSLPLSHSHSLSPSPYISQG